MNNKIFHLFSSFLTKVRLGKLRKIFRTNTVAQKDIFCISIHTQEHVIFLCALENVNKSNVTASLLFPVIALAIRIHLLLIFLSSDGPFCLKF